jgi:type I restriction enzyme S subunit
MRGNITQLTLPKGWVRLSLEDASQKVTDGSHCTPKYVAEGYPFITISNLKGDGIDFSSANLISEEDYKKAKDNCNPYLGDILFSKDGTVGKVIEINYGKPFIVLSSLAIIRPFKSFTISAYLKYLLQSREVLDQATKLKTGTALTRIILRNLKSVQIPIPPLAEQHRIVAKIEELFTKLDAGLEALKKIKAQLKRYRQAVLKHAFEGKLTEEWRQAHRGELEPASVLLDRIKQERHKTAKAKHKALPLLDTSDLPELADGWAWTKVGEISDVVSGQTPKEISNYGSSGEVPYFRVGDMNKSGNEKYMFHSKIGLGLADIKRLGLRVQPIGTVIFPKRGGAIATNKKRILAEPSAYDLNIMGIHPLIVLHMFLYYWMFSIDLAGLSDGSNVPQINHTDIEPLAFPLPPLLEQHRIVEEIERRFSVADQIEKTVDHSLKQAERLRQSILKRAFEGKLIPQDPSDEPAEKLLERIRQERARQQAEREPPKSSRSKSNTKRMRLV